MTQRPELTIKQAAESCGVSPKTIRRRLNADEFPNARRDGDTPQSPWIIPVTDLIAAGLQPNAPTPPDPEPVEATTAPNDTSTEVAGLQRQLMEADHQRQLMEATHRAEKAEAISAAKDEVIQSLKAQLLMLEPGPTPEVIATEDSETEPLRSPEPTKTEVDRDIDPPKAGIWKRCVQEAREVFTSKPKS